MPAKKHKPEAPEPQYEATVHAVKLDDGSIVSVEAQSAEEAVQKAKAGDIINVDEGNTDD